MSLFGYFWLFLVIFGYFWLFLVIFGNLHMGNLTDIVFSFTGWRAGFENPSMAWAFVQLHAYDLHDWSEFRNAQVSLPSISVFLFP